ncbi:MAG: sulfotransferase [Gammaproteobacteria bacterium]|nr:sulfotransferase [Gammaproteobacteria bacterium]
MLKYFTTALRGTAQARSAHELALRQHPNIVTGTAILQTLCPADSTNDHEAPIFLLSAGWRSGSTLLQRLIMSDSNVLIWGEPYDECGMIQALADTTKAFRSDWPPADYYYGGASPDKLSGEWIANLFPSLEDLRKGHRAFLDTMFAQPAKRAGTARWGIKEVRLGVEHGFYLRWLYPNARFLFLYRNPLDAYQSYCRYGRNWYNTYPGEPVFTPTAFGNHWRELMEGFLRDAKKLDALMIRYEDLVDGRLPLEEIEQYLAIQVNSSVLNTKVGSSERSGGKTWVSRLEKWLLKRAVSPIAADLGYEW